jgi:hypothetical protein
MSTTKKKEYTDPVVFRVRKPTVCGKCKEDLRSGRMIKLVDGENNQSVALCKVCSGLGDLFIVMAGNANLTRLCSKYSTQKHVIVRWASARKRYEREGILVELSALNNAEAELGMELTVDENSGAN